MDTIKYDKKLVLKNWKSFKLMYHKIWKLCTILAIIKRVLWVKMTKYWRIKILQHIFQSGHSPDDTCRSFPSACIWDNTGKCTGKEPFHTPQEKGWSTKCQFHSAPSVFCWCTSLWWWLHALSPELLWWDPYLRTSTKNCNMETNDKIKKSTTKSSHHAKTFYKR